MAHSSKDIGTDETELTMCDVLEEEQELEEDANAVLGGSDDTNCSYDKGYVPRQALYACKSCTVSAAVDQPGGVCLACCYACHDGHDVVELYTKRNFRCDCGNSKFPNNKCKLRTDKDNTNVKNKYNHNFSGLYCTCDRPYPDLEDNVPDEMIQCIMCEDWYHGRHIGSEVPHDYFEMICVACMEAHKFLYKYLNKLTYIKVDDDSETNTISNGPSKVKENISFDENKCIEKEGNLTNDLLTVNSETTVPIEHDVQFKIESKLDNHEKINASSERGKEPVLVKTENLEESACILKNLDIKSDGITKGPAFWPENWRSELCQCFDCMHMYTVEDCLYLLNLDDTVHAYEERGKCSNESQYDKGLSALSRLDRVKQMEAVRAYTNMKGQLKEYLKQFADNKRTVSEKDIKEFFERISKRQKLNSGVPYFCR